MNLGTPEQEKLTNIIDELNMIKWTLDYKGYDPNHISNEEAIVLLASKIVELIDIIKNDDNIDNELTEEEYEAIHGWGGQG